MEIKVTRKIEDGRYVSEFTIPKELWSYADMRRHLLEDLSRGAFDFSDNQQELRVRRLRITLYSRGPSMVHFLAENAILRGVERTLQWITKEEVGLTLPDEIYSWREGEFSIPIPLQETLLQ